MTEIAIVIVSVSVSENECSCYVCNIHVVHNFLPKSSNFLFRHKSWTVVSMMAEEGEKLEERGR